jgi:hypothetical protein
VSNVRESRPRAVANPPKGGPPFTRTHSLGKRGQYKNFDPACPSAVASSTFGGGPGQLSSLAYRLMSLSMSR